MLKPGLFFQRPHRLGQIENGIVSVIQSSKNPPGMDDFDRQTG